jgi:hypothetical protein
MPCNQQAARKASEIAVGFNSPDWMATSAAGFDSRCFDSPDATAGFDSPDGASGFDASALMATSAARAFGVAAPAVSEGFALGAVCKGLMSPNLVSALRCDLPSVRYLALFHVD